MHQLHTVLPNEAQIMLIAASGTEGLNETIKRVKLKFPYYFRKEALREIVSDISTSAPDHRMHRAS